MIHGLRGQLAQFGAVRRELLELWTPIPGWGPEGARARARRRRALTHLFRTVDRASFTAAWLACRRTLLEERGGDLRLLCMQTVYLDRAYTAPAAAILLHCHPNAIYYWHRAFRALLADALAPRPLESFIIRRRF